MVTISVFVEQPQSCSGKDQNKTNRNTASYARYNRPSDCVVKIQSLVRLIEFDLVTQQDIDEDWNVIEINITITIAISFGLTGSTKQGGDKPRDVFEEGPSPRDRPSSKKEGRALGTGQVR